MTHPSTPTEPRARDPKPSPAIVAEQTYRSQRTETDNRVAECLDLMIAKRWEPGKTAPELAERWGLTTHAVEQLSSQAARILRLAADPEHVSERVTRHLDEWLEWASVAPDRVALAKLRLEVAGVIGPRAERREALAAGAQHTSPEQRTASLSAVLRDPSPELARLIQDAVRAGPNGLTACLEACGCVVGGAGGEEGP